jgi:hypothetical protein
MFVISYLQHIYACRKTPDGSSVSIFRSSPCRFCQYAKDTSQDFPYPQPAIHDSTVRPITVHTGQNPNKWRKCEYKVGAQSVRWLYSHVACRERFKLHCSLNYLLQIYFTIIIIFNNPLRTEFLYNYIYKFSPYLTGNTLRLRYKAQPVNAVWRNSRCLLWEPYGTHKYTLWAECRGLVC